MGIPSISITLPTRKKRPRNEDEIPQVEEKRVKFSDTLHTIDRPLPLTRRIFTALKEERFKSVSAIFEKEFKERKTFAQIAHDITHPLFKLGSPLFNEVKEVLFGLNAHLDETLELTTTIQSLWSLSGAMSQKKYEDFSLGLRFLLLEGSFSSIGGKIVNKMGENETILTRFATELYPEFLIYHLCNKERELLKSFQRELSDPTVLSTLAVVATQVAVHLCQTFQKANQTTIPIAAPTIILKTEIAPSSTSATRIIAESVQGLPLAYELTVFDSAVKDFLTTYVQNLLRIRGDSMHLLFLFDCISDEGVRKMFFESYIKSTLTTKETALKAGMQLAKISKATDFFPSYISQALQSHILYAISAKKIQEFMLFFQGLCKATFTPEYDLKSEALQETSLFFSAASLMFAKNLSITLKNPFINCEIEKEPFLKALKVFSDFCIEITSNSTEYYIKLHSLLAYTTIHLNLEKAGWSSIADPFKAYLSIRLRSRHSYYTKLQTLVTSIHPTTKNLEFLETLKALTIKDQLIV